MLIYALYLVVLVLWFIFAVLWCIAFLLITPLAFAMVYLDKKKNSLLKA